MNNTHSDTNRPIRNELVFAAFSKAYTLTDYNTNSDLNKRHQFRTEIIRKDELLSPNEKAEAIKILNKRNDYDKIINNYGLKRFCENCEEECLATLYCELCIRNYLKENFSNWTSRHVGIDNLIQKCQMESIGPSKIIEWIPYETLRKIDYLTKGGCSEIYTAEWIDGNYYEWNSKEQRLERYGIKKVILKSLANVESANRSWFDEAKSHLTISNKWAGIIQCYGLTQDQSGNYMLVVSQMDIDLRKYLQQNHNILTWKKRIKIIVDIVDSLLRIHSEDAIHRDLHSGNILHLKDYDCWYISDLGFCGPADKPLGSIYGNLPYIAPEVIAGKECTKASDIYSIGMLMWEISSGQPPFASEENDYDLAMKIVSERRPKIVPGTPSEYEELMKQCWSADQSKRPDINTLYNSIIKLHKSRLTDPNKDKKVENNLLQVPTNHRPFKSKTYQTHQFKNLLHATEAGQEVEGLNKSNNQGTKSNNQSIFKVFSKAIAKPFKKVFNNTQKDKGKARATINEGDDYNNPNLHSREQNELIISDAMREL